MKSAGGGGGGETRREASRARKGLNKPESHGTYWYAASVHPSSPAAVELSPEKAPWGEIWNKTRAHGQDVAPAPSPHPCVSRSPFLPCFNPFALYFQGSGGRNGRDLGSITQTSPKHQSTNPSSKLLVSSSPLFSPPPPSWNKFWGAKPIHFALHPQPDPHIAAFVCKLLRNGGKELQLPSCAGPQEGVGLLLQGVLSLRNQCAGGGGHLGN